MCNPVRKSVLQTLQEKKVVAYHEIGHALVAALQSHSAPVQKITIIRVPQVHSATLCRLSRVINI